MTPTRPESSLDPSSKELNAPRKNVARPSTASGQEGSPEPTYWEKKRSEYERQDVRFRQACQKSASHLVNADAEGLALWWSIGRKICEILGCTDPYNNPLAERDNAIAAYGAQNVDTVAHQLGIGWQEALFSFNLFSNCDEKTITRMCEATLAVGRELFPRHHLAELLQDPEVNRESFPQVVSRVIQAGTPLKYSRRRRAQDEDTIKANRPLDKARRKLSHKLTNCKKLTKTHESDLEAISVIRGASDKSSKDYAHATSVAFDLSEKLQETIENMSIIKGALDNLVFDDEFSTDEQETASNSQA